MIHSSAHFKNYNLTWNEFLLAALCIKNYKPKWWLMTTTSIGQPQKCKLLFQLILCQFLSVVLYIHTNLAFLTIAKHNSGGGCLIVGVGVSNFITVSHFLYAQFSTDHLSNPNSRWVNNFSLENNQIVQFMRKKKFHQRLFDSFCFLAFFSIYIGLSVN